MKKLLCIMVLALVAVAQAEIMPGMVKIYEGADVDKNGKVDLEEWKPVVKKRFEERGKPDWETQSIKQFKNLDKDKDGFLTLVEFWPGQSK